MQARSIVNKFAATLAEIKAKTIDGTVRYIWADIQHIYYPLVEALVDVSAEPVVETLALTYQHHAPKFSRGGG